MISHKHKFIFVHIPKCAGTTIENTLSNGIDIFNWNHRVQEGQENPLPYGQLRKRGLAETLNAYPDYYVFTFCRDPWQRIISTYLHLQRSINSNAYFKRTLELGTFAEFVESVYHFIKTREDIGLSFFEKYHVQPQISFYPVGGKYFKSVCLKSEIEVDYLGRVENFDEDFSRLCGNLKLHFKQLRNGHRSKSNNGLKYYYDQSLIDKVAVMYADDAEFFGYSAPNLTSL